MSYSYRKKSRKHLQRKLFMRSFAKKYMEIFKKKPFSIKVFPYYIDSKAIHVLVPSRGWGNVAAVCRASGLLPTSGVSRAMLELKTTNEILISVSWISSCCTKLVIDFFREL